MNDLSVKWLPPVLAERHFEWHRLPLDAQICG